MCVTASSAGAKPVISSPLPINTTVHQGDLATLYCTVVSEVEPTIQVIFWFYRYRYSDNVSLVRNSIRVVTFACF